MTKGRAIAVGLLLALFAMLATDASAATKPSRKKPDPQPGNAVSFELDYEDFGDAYKPWSLATAELSHRFDFGSVIGRVNRARRFGKSGTQIEVDAYPRLGRGMYLYTNAGVSQDSIFPRRRFGVELYKSLPSSFEASLGLRQLSFTRKDVTLFTGSVAKYRGNNYYVIRQYLSRRSGGTSFSGQFMVRTYFATADDYASLMATVGNSPTEDIAPDAVDRLVSWSVRASAQRVLSRNLIVTTRVGYRDEAIRLSAHRRGWVVGMGVKRRF